jgi:nucleotide-binding universal stress UspA family protein
MPHLLVPTDFTDASENALMYAVQLAQRWQAPIRMLYCYEKPYDFAAQVEHRVAAIRKEAKKQLQLEVEALQATPGLDELAIDFQVTEGTAERCIRRTAEDLPDAWVVMGHGRSVWLQNWMSGDTAVEFAQQSPVPVLVVPPQKPFDAPQELVFATRFAEAEAEDIAQAAMLAQAFDAKLRLVHIAENRSHEEEMRYRGFRDEVQESLNYPNLEVEMVTAESVLSGIKKLFNTSEHSWLAVSHIHRSFLSRLFKPSITRELLEKQQVPVLVFTHQHDD